MDDELTTWKGSPVVEIDRNRPLNQGDRVILRFKWILGGLGTYAKSVQVAMIEDRMRGRSDFRILSLVDQGDYLDIEVEVLQSSEPQINIDPGSGVTQVSLFGPAALLTCAFIAAAISTAIITVTIYHYKSYLVSKVVSGELPESVLTKHTSFGEAASGLRSFGYAALVVVCGYVLMRLFSRNY